jgi:hypothetical protein
MAVKFIPNFAGIPNSKMECPASFLRKILLKATNLLLETIRWAMLRPISRSG